MHHLYQKYIRAFLHIVSALIILISMFYIYLTKFEYYEHTDSIMRDYIFEIRGELPSSGNVIIVDIDEKSLQKYGQWPWSRDLVAKLINNIMASGAYVVGLDIVFAEKDKTSPHNIAQKIDLKNIYLPDYDEILANTLYSYNGLIVGGLFLTNNEYLQDYNKSADLDSSVYIQRGGSKYMLEFKSVTKNIDSIQNVLASSGFLNTIPDKDGTVRHVPMVMKTKTTGIYPSLAFEMYKVYLGKSGTDIEVSIEGNDDGIDGIYVDSSVYIPTDKFGQILVNYRGASKTFKYISAIDVLEMKESVKNLNETFVLVGTSAIGLFDMRPTPFDSSMPGVEIHANVLDSLLMNDFITVSPDEQTLVLFLILFIVLVSVLLFALSNEYFILPLFLSMLYGLYYLNYILLFEYKLVINIVIPFLSLIVSFIVTVAIDYILTSSQKKVLTEVFSKKVSSDVMNDLIEHNSEGLLEPVEKEVSVFFSDIRSFTSISEHIGSPHKLITLLNQYMTPMVDIIINEHGTVDKFIGDAIMAYWNSPIEIKNHSDYALRSAIKQIEKLKEINIELKKDFDIELNIGIGLHTGIVTVGDMGSVGRSDYTIIGDHVNLASRLEGLTKNYKAKIIISSSLKDKLVDSYKIRSLDFVKVKGKDKAVEIFEVIVDDNVTKEEIDKYEEAISIYRKARIIKAYKIFKELDETYSSAIYKIYMQRCEYYINNQDVKFDVTLTMTTK